MIVRRIKDLDDVNAGVKLAKWFFNESPRYATIGMEDDKIGYILCAAIDTPNMMFCDLVEDDGVIVGMLVGAMNEYYFTSGKRSANEMICMVLPEHRGKDSLRAMQEMFTNFETWARKNDALECIVGVSSGIASDGYGKFLSRRGYSHFSEGLTKEINHGSA